MRGPDEMTGKETVANTVLPPSESQEDATVLKGAVKS